MKPKSNATPSPPKRGTKVDGTHIPKGYRVIRVGQLLRCGDKLESDIQPGRWIMTGFKCGTKLTKSHVEINGPYIRRLGTGRKK